MYEFFYESNTVLIVFSSVGYTDSHHCLDAVLLLEGRGFGFVDY